MRTDLELADFLQKVFALATFKWLEIILVPKSVRKSDQRDPAVGRFLE